MSDQEPFLEALLSGIAEEAFLIEINSLNVVAATNAACRHLNISPTALQRCKLQDLLGVSDKKMKDLISALQHSSKMLNASQHISRNDDPEKMHILGLDDLSVSLLHAHEHEYLLIRKPTLPNDKNTVSSQGKNQAQIDSESRFKALVENTPGLVFEFQLNQHNEIQFNYLSDGCKALLGIDAATLKKSPKKFFKMIDKEDLERLQLSINSSASSVGILNWDGRVWIEAWQDTKWVNMRSMPAKLANGEVFWVGIMTNITQSKNERNELAESRQRMAELSAHLTHAKEEERSRIAREIHDDLGGNLTVIKLGLASLLKKLPANELALIEKAQQLEAIIDNTFEAAHRISGDLRPNILELGIVAALEWQAKEFEKQMDIACYFVANQKEIVETNEQAITLFRICQEAMSNIAKYAKASRVDIALIFSFSEIKMYVTDNGIGIAPGDMLKPNSFGLRGMAERVAALNGTFSIEKASDKGTNIVVTLPMPINIVDMLKRLSGSESDGS